MKGEILLHLVWQTADLPMIGVPSTTWIPDETPPLVQKLMISRKRREKGRKRAMQGKRKHNPAGKILQWASWDSKNAYTIRKKRIVKKDNKEPLWRTYHCHQFQLGMLLPQSNSSTLDSTAIRKCPPTNDAEPSITSILPLTLSTSPLDSECLQSMSEQNRE